MKQFKFKLESVLNYRTTLEDVAKTNYREALRVLNIEKEKLHQFEGNQKALMVRYNFEAGAVVHTDTLAFISRYSAQLIHLIHGQKLIIEKKREIANGKFILWNQRRQEVKVVEKLKEKKWNQYLREVNKEEQQFQDEIFIAKQIRDVREGQTHE